MNNKEMAKKLKSPEVLEMIKESNKNTWDEWVKKIPNIEVRSREYKFSVYKYAKDNWSISYELDSGTKVTFNHGGLWAISEVSENGELYTFNDAPYSPGTLWRNWDTEKTQLTSNYGKSYSVTNNNVVSSSSTKMIRQTSNEQERWTKYEEIIFKEDPLNTPVVLYSTKKFMSPDGDYITSKTTGFALMKSYWWKW